MLLKAAPNSGTPETETLVHLIRLSPPASCFQKERWRLPRLQEGWKVAGRGEGKSVSHGGGPSERARDGVLRHLQGGTPRREVVRGGPYFANSGVGSAPAVGPLQTGQAQRGPDRFRRSAGKGTRPSRGATRRARAALGLRFSAVLVDEFQDTDPLQCEILWRLCGEAPPGVTAWTDYILRPGSLFLVGDPKQAIYRFRGADVNCYVAARGRLLAADAGARVVIGQNFRSVGAILDWVNDCFAAPLSLPSQPGFETLFTAIKAFPGQISVATLPVIVPDGGKADDIRDAEAEAVASFCARIIGSLQVRGKERIRSCQPDDIALLAPTGTDLWRYERALEAEGIAVSTQAGKGFYRRQEVQDLIALTRVLADARDTLALGALLRGPLVGLTEEELLDAVASLPGSEETGARLYLWTPSEQIGHPLLRRTLDVLQILARHARATTPFVLLCQAVEELQVRPLLRQRQGRTAERALANLDLFLEGARSYDVRGLAAFAAAMRAQWEDAQRAMEGRPDTEQQSVSLVTMHSSKGLEWPVVIPVNTGTRVMDGVDAALDLGGFLHLPVFGLHGPGADAALQSEREEIERERHRLWYVATTRARDLLLLFRRICRAERPRGSWVDALPLGLQNLPSFESGTLDGARLERADDNANHQDRAKFETEAACIASRINRIIRITPYLAEAGEEPPAPLSALPLDADEDSVQLPPARGSLARGLILHKLLEEVLTRETPDHLPALQQRAVVLARELEGMPGAADIDVVEVAGSVLRGLALPEIRPIRDRLVPECWVANSVLNDGAEQITLGVADAVLRDTDGHIALVVDWKSDVDPGSATVARYRSQVGAYLDATGAKQGMIVFLSSGLVEKVGSRFVAS